MISTDTARSIANLHQHLLAMMPRGWTSIRIDIARDGANNFVHLTNLNTQLRTGGTAPPALGLDKNELVGAMNEALGTIASNLGDAWRGLAARMDRSEDGGALLVLVGPDGAEQSRIALVPDAVDSLLLSDALFDALDATRPRAHAAQVAFEEAIRGFQRWDLVQDRAELSFVLADGRTWAMNGQLIGSWSKDSESWMWGWQNESVHPACGALARSVREGARDRKGLAALTTGSFSAKKPFAVELALHASALIGARGVFLGDFGAGIAFIAAMP
jgi:hypothetical protein